MNTFTSPTLTQLLPKLFADADATTLEMRERWGAMPEEERLRRMRDPDYRAMYHRMKDAHLAVSPETGKLLYMLARTCHAQEIVEFGTSFGLSTIHLAAALKDNGGGTLIGTELEPGKVAHARANLKAAGLESLVEIREGDALETLAKGLPEAIDLVLLDGHKPLYAKVLDLLAPRLRSGACLVADNADACPDYIARVRNPSSGYLSVPFADDVELSMKL